MISSELSLVTLPERRVPEITIDSANLVDFLTQQDYLEHVHLRFAPYLDLSFLETSLRELAEFRKIVNVFPTEELQRLSPEDPWGIIERLADKKGRAERTRTVFWDPDKNLIFITPIISGDFSSTGTQINDLLDQDFCPMLLIHTHPSLGLFSPNDYAYLLAESDMVGKRIVPALLVMSPGFQVLALATPQTPLFTSYDKVNGFIAEKNVSIEEAGGQRKKELKSRRERVVEIFQEHLVKAQEGEIRYLERLSKEIESGQISEEELQVMAKEREKIFGSQLNKYYEKYLRVLQRVSLDFWSYVERLINEKLVRCTRDTCVKLYFSTNMKDFLEFAA